MGLQLSWDRRDTLWLGANLHWCETTIQDLAYAIPVMGWVVVSKTLISQLAIWSLPTLLERISEDIEQLRHTLAGRLVGIAVVGSLYGLDAAHAG